MRPARRGAARPGDGDRAAEARDVAFADFVGSTALGEGDPEETRARLERFYDAIAISAALDLWQCNSVSRIDPRLVVDRL